MTETIFSPSFGNRPSYLIGRGNVISTFMSGLEQEPGNRDRAMLMLGQRGSGKTVLLWELADRAQARLRCCHTHRGLRGYARAHC